MILLKVLSVAFVKIIVTCCGFAKLYHKIQTWTKPFLIQCVFHCENQNLQASPSPQVSPTILRAASHYQT